MQEFFHAGDDAGKDISDSFEKMLRGERTLYLDVDQIESLYDHYVEIENYEMADKVLSIGLLIHPNSLSLKIRQASQLTDLGDLDKALDMLNILKIIDGNNSDIYVNLGWIFLKKNQMQKAIRQFEIAVEVADKEDREDLLVEIGTNLNQNGYFNEALRFLFRCALINVNNESCVFEMAYAYDQVGKVEHSIEAYEHLLNLNPFLENAWYNLAILYNKTDRFQDALDAYDYAIAINPNYADAYFNKANTFVNMGRFADALDSYFEHASFKGDLNLTYQYIGDCWEQLGHGEMAIRFFQKSLELDPQNADAMYGCSTALISLGRNDEAMLMIKQAISVNPMNSDYYFAMAQVYLETKDLKQCINSIEIGLSLSPNEILAWIELVKMKSASSKRFNADMFLKKAMREYGQTTHALLYLDAYISFFVHNDIDQTAAKLTKAIEAAPQMIDEIKLEISQMLAIEPLRKIIEETKPTE